MFIYIYIYSSIKTQGENVNSANTDFFFIQALRSSQPTLHPTFKPTPKAASTTPPLPSDTTSPDLHTEMSKVDSKVDSIVTRLFEENALKIRERQR